MFEKHTQSGAASPRAGGADSTTGRELQPGNYAFDAVKPGDWLHTAEAEITPSLIDAFAEMTGDHFAIHTSDKAAQAKGFPTRIAHGLLVLALIDGLKNQAAAQFDAVASLGWNWTFRRPVPAGTRISARITVLSKRSTRRPDRGILKLGFSVRSASGEMLQEGSNLLLVERDPAPA